MANKMKNNKLLVIIPAFNEGKVILNTVNKVIDAGLDYVVVNDCSYDATDLICKENKLNYISNVKNLGLSKTMREGFKYALENNYEYSVQFDGDGQHDINTILEMYNIINNKNIDIVLANRFKKFENKNYDKDKEFIWKILRNLIKFNCKQYISDPTNGLRMFNKKFMRSYIKFKKFEVEPSTISYCIRKLNMKVSEVETQILPRLEGESYFNNKWKIFKYLQKQFRRLLITNYFWLYKI